LVRHRVLSLRKEETTGETQLEVMARSVLGITADIRAKTGDSIESPMLRFSTELGIARREELMTSAPLSEFRSTRVGSLVKDAVFRFRTEKVTVILKWFLNGVHLI
jgi:hypothetical protein